MRESGLATYPSEQIQRAYAFGPFVLVPERQQLMEGETPVRIGGRALDILTLLVERPGEVVEKRDLLARVWPGMSVDDANLKVNMGIVRRALGESAPPKYIATVVGRGYRFIAPVLANRLGDAVDRSDAGETPAEQSHNLPIGATQVLGRTDSIGSMLDDLENARLVSIVGMGGVGKTTVALAAAEKAIGLFADGVWLVDLATLKEPSLVPNAIATAIGLNAHSANMTAALCAFLQDRDMLLLMDNCEHLIDSVAICVQRILTSARKVKILATSREPLCVRGERVRRLSGLETPPASIVTTAGEALAFPAVRLFVARATDRNPEFTLNDVDALKVGAICRKLDGVALAIELAAARTDAFSIPELLERLDDRFRLLQGRRAGPERHRTLAAMIDWSYELLSDSEQTTMRRLSIFAGSFSLAAACAVAADETIDPRHVVDDLASLVSKSLVAVDALDVEIDYRMLDTTRAYAFAKLSASRELESIRRRQAEYAFEIVDRAKEDSATLANSAWLKRYGSKIDDIRNAQAFSLSGRGNPALGVRLTVAAISYWEKLSLLEENRMAVERALDDAFLMHRTRRDDLLLILAQAAAKLFTRGPLPEVRLLFSKALEIAETLGDVDLQLECLRGLSQYDLWAGDSRSSLAIANRVRELAAAKKEGRAATNADGQTGSALHSLGDLAAARRHLESFLDTAPFSALRTDVSRFEFDQRLEARGSLAMVLWLQGFSDQALAMARRQRDEAEVANFAMPRCAAILLTSVCVELYVGNFEETERQLDFAEEYAAEHQLTLWNTVAACMRVKLHIDMGRPVDLESYGRILAEIRNGGLGLRYPPFLANYGHLLSLRGDLDGALRCIDDAIALYARSGQDWGIPEMLTMRGNFIRAGESKGYLEAAADCYSRSIEMARRHGSLTWQLRAAIQLVDLWRNKGGSDEAESILSSTYRQFSEGLWTSDLRRAATLLQIIA
ncbi:putative ATPase/DNA-binding winged helix-turn-helix (wHTH) protein [Rhizobium sp. SG_E_25_P2]|nr:putative ATPase/DNA-binding winged helix-turn-helix (wHTH) protein [Rhizobium sp. SG_E_25_P2]